jgi:hypothetical protein
MTVAISFFQWMLALHLLFGFALGASMVLYAVMVFAGRRMTTLEETRKLFRVAPVGSVLVMGGSIGAVVLGVVLAIDGGPTDLHLWDGWIIAAIVLYVAMAVVGSKTGAYYTAVEKAANSGDPAAEADVIARLRAPTGANLHWATVAIFVLLVLDMIVKPGG